MRIQHWLASIWSVAFTLSVVVPATAQVPTPLTAMTPAPIYGNSAPGYGGPGYSPIGSPESIPPGMNPWPTISPFEHQYAQTANRDGLWESVYGSGGRQYWFTADALLSKVRRPNRTLVGSEGDARPAIQIVDATGTVTTLSLPAGFGEVTVGGAPDDEVVGTIAIDDEIIGQEKEISTSLGMRLKWGYEDPDGSMFEVDGWWQSEAHFSWKRGQGDFFGPAQTARQTAVLPLFDGTQIDRIPFSQVFRIQTDSESAGTSVNFISTESWGSRSGAFTIHPMWGIQYTFIREHFMFQGADSGEQISYTADGAPDITSAVPLVPRYWSALDSTVRSHLAGPHIGLWYRLGKDRLAFKGSTKVGLMANHNRMDLNGQGIGNPYLAGFNNDLRFEQFEDHTNVSPMIEQTITAEAPLFSYIPLLREIKLLEEAKLRVGYSILAFWEVTRPGDSIVWQGQPLNPYIDVERTKWYVHGWNIGIDWRY